MAIKMKYFVDKQHVIIVGKDDSEKVIIHCAEKSNRESGKIGVQLKSYTCPPSIMQYSNKKSGIHLKHIIKVFLINAREERAKIVLRRHFKCEDIRTKNRQMFS